MSINEKVWSSVWESVQRSIYGSVRVSFRDFIQDSVENSIRTLAWSSVFDPVWSVYRGSVPRTINEYEYWK